MSTPNERARAAALKAGNPTFKMEVIDLWPACVQCNEVIRLRGQGAKWYSCKCPDVFWIPFGTNGWERRPVG